MGWFYAHLMLLSQVGLWRLTPTDLGKQCPDLCSYPMAAVQEPPQHRQANCTFMAFYKPSDIGIIRQPGSIAFVALYAARDLAAGEELFVHYGNDKNRDYPVGLPAPNLNKADIPPTEYPHHWLAGLPPHADAWRNA